MMVHVRETGDDELPLPVDRRLRQAVRRPRCAAPACLIRAPSMTMTAS